MLLKAATVQRQLYIFGTTKHEQTHIKYIVQQVFEEMRWEEGGIILNTHVGYFSNSIHINKIGREPALYA